MRASAVLPLPVVPGHIRRSEAQQEGKALLVHAQHSRGWRHDSQPFAEGEQTHRVRVLPGDFDVDFAAVPIDAGFPAAQGHGNLFGQGGDFGNFCAQFCRQLELDETGCDCAAVDPARNFVLAQHLFDTIRLHIECLTPSHFDLPLHQKYPSTPDASQRGRGIDQEGVIGSVDS